MTTTSVTQPSKGYPVVPRTRPTNPLPASTQQPPNRTSTTGGAPPVTERLASGAIYATASPQQYQYQYHSSPYSHYPEQQSPDQSYWQHLSGYDPLARELNQIARSVSIIPSSSSSFSSASTTSGSPHYYPTRR